MDQCCSVCPCNYPFFSVQLILVATQLLRASELPGVRCLALSVSPASTEDFLSTVDTAETTRHPDTLVTQTVKSQTNQLAQRLDLGVSGCWAQGHQLEHLRVGIPTGLKQGVYGCVPRVQWFAGLHFFVLKEPTGKHFSSAAAEPSPYHVLVLVFELLINL